MIRSLGGGHLVGFRTNKSGEIEDLLRVSLNVRLPWVGLSQKGGEDPGNLSVELKRKIHTVLLIYK